MQPMAQAMGRFNERGVQPREGRKKQSRAGAAFELLKFILLLETHGRILLFVALRGGLITGVECSSASFSFVGRLW